MATSHDKYLGSFNYLMHLSLCARMMIAKHNFCRKPLSFLVINNQGCIERGFPWAMKTLVYM